ncbi:MAG: 5'/3'-nucleotidase SurE [Parachlamydia sp.]|jgi:5'-nucleotidase|nr:5'/3'-nucleotidase SurE [Parachlamydia sp.]
MPLILICNDDGVNAPGIKKLWKAVHSLGDAYVVAPDNEQSAVSLSITVRSPLRVEKMEWESLKEAKTWSINGTPADCIKLGLNAILPARPQIILSGINCGTNAGRNILYSGTVAAAIEGALHQIPSIAFSTCDITDPPYEEIKTSIQKIVKYILKHSLPNGTLLNVNFPKKVHGPLRGIKLAEQGRELIIENPEMRKHPSEKKVYYWMGAKLASFHESPFSDIHLLTQGFVTVVPIDISDLTNYRYLKEEKANFEAFF